MDLYNKLLEMLEVSGFGYLAIGLIVGVLVIRNKFKFVVLAAVFATICYYFSVQMIFGVGLAAIAAFF